MQEKSTEIVQRFGITMCLTAVMGRGTENDAAAAPSRWHNPSQIALGTWSAWLGCSFADEESFDQGFAKKES
ncbi:hypothetical protein VTH82DRAFT_5906 [Thermothelomyces myriococcoides]